MRRSKSPLPQSFVTKKKTILDQLSVPASEYGDLSPKGSIDEGIRELIDEINLIEGCVTTSSCSGRISVFLEGKKHVGEGVLCDQVRAGEDKGVVRGGQDEMPAFTEKGKIKETRAGVGGKGGGRWLYVSHSEVETNQHELAGGLAGLLGMEVLQEDPPRDAGRRFIHFKFEPMILHVLTASFEHAQIVLSAALQAGFRESGAINLTTSTKDPPTPMVAVRSMGLALESLVGFHQGGRELCNVPEEALRTLLEIANERFQFNATRIAKFRELLIQSTSPDIGPNRKGDGVDWEDAKERKNRKRLEGLRRKEMLKDRGDPLVDPEDIAGLEFFQ